MIRQPPRLTADNVPKEDSHPTTSLSRTQEMRTLSRFRRQGLTLLEALIAALLLAVVTVAVSQAILASQMQTLDVMHRSRALELAEVLMEEILRLPYDDPDGTSALGPDTGETLRGDFDNVDDFHGFTESAGNVADAAGLTYEESYQVFSRSVSIQSSSTTVPAFVDPIEGLSITVSVQDSLGASWSLQTFCAKP